MRVKIHFSRFSSQLKIFTKVYAEKLLKILPVAPPPIVRP